MASPRSPVRCNDKAPAFVDLGTLNFALAPKLTLDLGDGLILQLVRS